MTVVSAIRHLARWLVWHIGELDRPPESPPARITVFSSAEQALPGEESA
jgi:hypothetical protein